MSSDVPFSHTALTDEEAAAVKPGEVHEVTERQYIIIALLLAVLTAAEVAATEIDLGAALVPALLVMMAIKFFTVASYFMHLKFDNRLFSVMFYLGLAMAVSLYVVVLATFHFF